MHDVRSLLREQNHAARMAGRHREIAPQLPRGGRCREGAREIILPLIGRKLDGKSWGEPLRWHKFFGHSFGFHKGVLVSPSWRRGLVKGTEFESLSPAALSKSFCHSRCLKKHHCCASRATCHLRQFNPLARGLPSYRQPWMSCKQYSS